MQFINKLFTKALFSDASELNTVNKDLGENMITVSLQEDSVARLKTATGTIGSLQIFVPVEVEIDVLKTSAAYEQYLQRVRSNGYIGGTLTVYDDVNVPHEFTEITLAIRELGAINGTEPAVKFVAAGNYEVNKDAIVGL